MRARRTTIAVGKAVAFSAAGLVVDGEIRTICERAVPTVYDSRAIIKYKMINHLMKSKNRLSDVGCPAKRSASGERQICIQIFILF